MKTLLLGITVSTLALRTTAATISNASSVFVYNGEQSNEQFVFAYAVDTTENDIYIHMSAPAGNAWMAVGAGSSMKDTLMLIAYPSKNGTGMTLSPRIATGHREPSYTDKVTCDLVYADDLEDGNTVTNDGYQGSGLFGTMTVNAVCHNATTDQSKSPLIAGFPVGFSDAMSPFIFAVGPGTVGNNNLQSNSPTASLCEHDFYGQFSMNATAATAPTGSQAQVPRPNAADNNYTLSNADAAYATHADNDPAPIIHAGVMCITFVFIYPLGAMLLRILNKVKSHAVVQCIGLVLTTMATAGGIVMSFKYNKSKNFNSAHQIIGILIFIALWAQLTLGILNHRTFKQTGQKTTMGKVHLYLGPAVIFLGWINAPLGFVFGGNPHACLPYIVILLAVIIIYLSLRFCSHLCCGKRRKKNGAGPRQAEGAMQAGVEGYQYPQFGSVGVGAGGQGQGQTYMQPPPSYSRHPYERQPSYRSEDVMLRPVESRESALAGQQAAQPRTMI